MTYRAPVDALRFSLAAIGDLADDDVEPILREAARFAEERLAPQNRLGDKFGARFANGEVMTPDGWPAIYKAWAEAGWNGVDLPTAWGGMGLQTRLAAATMEIWTSACMSFALGPVLTQGAVDTLELHASDALKAAYLPRLVSGDWTATMNLTEPQAGSDLGLLRTRADRGGDGSYRITGSKIYITYGEHDLTDNIVHLVLARLADAPAGTRGISLFLVPKLLPDGSRNGVACTGIEHKLGIHASPTCSMSFENAAGWLVGEENRGLACMFTMMNKARLFTGLQGVAVAELAYQKALAFARERRQGRAAGVAGTSAIIAHPDVRRNLMTMRALTAAGRALAHEAARAIDEAHAGDAAAEERAALLTPVVKAWCSDIGVEAASIGVQIHGGMGYVEETGAAQLLRDARITPIYEGTNGIQAIDLVTRKVLRPDSAAVEEFIADCHGAADACVSAALGGVGAAARQATQALEEATAWLRCHDGEALLGAATPYLELFGITAGMALLARSAAAARRRLDAGDDAAAARDAIVDAAFFAGNIAPRAAALARIVAGGTVPGPDAFSEAGA